MKKVLLIGLFVLFPFLASAFQTTKEEAIVLKTPTGDIYGTLRCPEKKMPVPVVLIIAGSGPTDRNGNQLMMQNNSLKLLSEGLYENGIAAVSFDKRGIAASQAAGKNEADLRFDDYVDDVRLWIDMLSKDKRFYKIIVAGHSEGSLIGMIACEGNDKVKQYISISGSGVPADEIIKEQVETQSQEAKDMVDPIISQLKEGRTVSEVSPVLYSLFRPSIQPYLISWFKYNPQVEIKKLTIPILIVQGTTDIQIPVKHAELLAAANTSAEKEIIKNMNHVLKDCISTDQQIQMAAYKNPDLPLNSEILSDIIWFIDQQ